MATYTVTTAFTANTTAVAAEVNENFTDVLTALNAFDGANITDGTITSSELGTDCVIGAKIADNALDSEHYTDGSIDTAHLADDCVTFDKSKNPPDPTSYTGGETTTFPNGLIIKMGYAAKSGTSTTVTFDAAFSTAIITVIVTNRYSSTTYDPPVVTSQSTSNFVVYCTVNVTGYNWMAIGY